MPSEKRSTSVRAVLPGVAALVAAGLVLVVGAWAQITASAAVDAEWFGHGVLTPVESFTWAVSWTGGAVPWYLLLALAVTVGDHVRRVVTVGTATLAVWTLAAFLPPSQPALPWPGPVVPWFADDELTSVTPAHPGALAPLVLLVAGALVVVGASTLRRTVAGDGSGRADVVVPPVTAQAGRAGRAGTALGVLVLYCAASLGGVAAVARVLPTVGPWWTTRDTVHEAAAPVVLGVALIVVAALASGRGTWTLAPLLLAWAAVAAPEIGEWFTGARDAVLVGALASGAATVVAWSWRPLRHAAFGR